MKTVEQWLSEYGESHQNPANKTLHWICVPTIVVSLVGFLWSIPVPDAVREISPLINWGAFVLLLAVLYYLRMSVSLAIGMLAFSILVALCIRGLENLPWSLWVICSALFVVAWIGQFIGHHFEGKRPSFFKDIQFLMIGPLWLLSFLYRKLRIPY